MDQFFSYDHNHIKTHGMPFTDAMFHTIKTSSQTVFVHLRIGHNTSGSLIGCIFPIFYFYKAKTLSIQCDQI